MPDIVFKLDTSIEQGSRILELIRENEKALSNAGNVGTEEIMEEEAVGKGEKDE